MGTRKKQFGEFMDVGLRHGAAVYNGHAVACPYTVIYAKRKTLSLSVNPTGEVVIKASPRHPKRLIDQFVTKHIDWIVKRREQLQTASAKQKTFAEGELFLYLGKEYPLEVIPEFRSRLHFDGRFLISSHKQPQGKRLFMEWYKKEAEKIVTERAKFFAGLMNLKYKSIRIKNMHTRWGSCSSLGNLNFSWRLVLAPLEIVDYVVVHELAHIVHKNHSKRFWELTGQFYPGWKPAREWLNKNGENLII